MNGEPTAHSVKMETGPVFVQCEYCRGTGEPYDGVTCAECDGFGTVEVEGEPITLEDLDADE